MIETFSIKFITNKANPNPNANSIETATTVKNIVFLSAL